MVWAWPHKREHGPRRENRTGHAVFRPLPHGRGSVQCRRLAHGYLVAGVIGLLVCCTGCERQGADRASRFANMETADVAINEHSFRVWVARTDNDIRNGLMHVTSEELAELPDGSQRGMLFIFGHDRSATSGFWMKNVPIPLDIAFIRADGMIVTIRTMVPFDHRTTEATASYRWALETSGGLFESLSIGEGDAVQIPQSLLNSTG